VWPRAQGPLWVAPHSDSQKFLEADHLQPTNALDRGGQPPAEQRPVVVVVLGTRPELIKMATSVHALRKLEGLETVVVFTGQHTELMEHAAAALDIVPDIRIAPLPAGRTLTHFLGSVVHQLGDLLTERRPDCVVVQGDTASVLAGALVAELLAIPLVHVEAGVRSGLRDDPFPEETIRRMIAPMSELHLSFSTGTRDNLVSEGIDPATIAVVPHPLKDRLDRARPPAREAGPHRILTTMHRRERRRERVEVFLELLARLRADSAELLITFIWHPSLDRDFPDLPGRLSDLDVEVRQPVPADDFLGLLFEADLVVTDSAGLAEEAHLAGKPLLALRNSAELRIDDPAAAPWCKTEAVEVAVEFVQTCLQRSGDPGPAVPALPVTAPSGVVIASEIEQFLRRRRRESG
jgi:UDP-N-acetylglucosamine 2-epimerase (non-hydrolysing)